MDRNDGETSTLLERGWGNKVGMGDAPALIVVDFTRAFTDPGTDLGSNCDAAILKTNELVSAFRKAGYPIYFSTIVFDDPDMRDAGTWRFKIRGLSMLQRNTKWPDMDPRLSIEGSDRTIEKKQASCFFETDLAESLRRQSVDTLVIAGCSTSGCVRATAVDGAQYGFRVIVARDAVTDRDSDAHRQNLRDIDLKYGDVLDVSEILEERIMRAD